MSKTATDLLEPSRSLLPTLADVEAALAANMRERKRLMTLKRLVLDASGQATEETSHGTAGETD